MAEMAELLHLHPGQIKHMKDIIEQSDDRFTLTQHTLISRCNFPLRTAQSIISCFDREKLGYIDSYEFLCACILLSNSTFDQKAEMLFNLYDNDHNTYLTFDEVIVMMSNSISAVKALDGHAPPTMHQIREKAVAFFKVADSNADEYIQLHEFKTYLKKEKTILEAIQNTGFYKKQDLGIGQDFGNGEEGTPDFDSDLEEECVPTGKNRDQEKLKKKEQMLNHEQGEFQEVELGDGDQFMATRQTYPAPDSYKNSKIEAVTPEATLELEHVFGYRSHDVRNNLRFTADGMVVYHCAAVGVVLDQVTNTQTHFLNHRDDIHCLAIDPTGTLCATGEIGPKPRLCLWNCRTMQEIAQVNVPLTKGIKHVTFSSDGNYLGCSDMSDDHSIAIFKVGGRQGLTCVAKGKGVRENIMSLGFNPQGGILVATCVKSVVFFQWSSETATVKGTRGTGWGSIPADTILCQSFVGQTLFTGNLSGEIISWTGSAIAKRTKAHTQKVNCMYSVTNTLVSGSQDGLVQIWQVQGTNIAQKYQLDLKIAAIESVMPAAVSVCLNGTKLLVGTRGAEIIEFDYQSRKLTVLMRGHFDSELWGLAVHPTQAKVATWGRDALICVWDIETKQRLQIEKLQSGGDALSYSNNGQYLALGFLNGILQVFDDNLKMVVQRKDRMGGKAIQVIKFSPDDSLCVVGAHDQLILTYDVKNGFKPLKKLKGHSSTVKFIDFTLDSSAFMSLCQAYETLYFDCTSGKQNTRGASQFKNEIWASWTHPLGWPVQGIWPPCADGSDINAIDRSAEGNVIATADDFSTVKLYNFPSPQPKEAPHLTYFGHSSHVTNVQFTKHKIGQRYLITTGGEDKCIFQWKYFPKKQQQQSKTGERSFNQQASTNIESEFEFQEQDLGLGDQALAVKPWVGAVKAMTPQGFNPASIKHKEPVRASMNLVWAHGFRSFDTTGNLKYAHDGHILFTTAGVGIVQNTLTKTQNYFNEHHEDIVALAYHPDSHLVATGQMAGKEITEKSASVNKNPIDGKFVRILIWDARTCEQVGLPLTNFHRRAIRQLAFSPNGNFLLSIGEDDQHQVAVYDVYTRQIVAKQQVDPSQVFMAAWHINKFEFSTCGVKHLKTFSLGSGEKETLTKQSCQISTITGGQIVTSVNYVLSDGKLVTGTNQGNLLLWSGTSLNKQFDGHTKGSPIWCIEKGVDCFYTGGKDGLILLWSPQFQKAIKVDLNKWQINDCGIRSFDVGQNGNVLVGTIGATILECNKGNTARPVVLNQGHFKSQSVKTHQEVWGCTSHPEKQYFATCGGDGRVRVWSQKAMIAVSLPLKDDPTSLDWSSNGKWIAVGDRNATITILDSGSLAVLDTLSSAVTVQKAAAIKGAHNFKTEQWIEVLRFSPDSTKVAYGHHGLQTTLEFVHINFYGKIMDKPSIKSRMFSSAVNHLDWSQDGLTILVTTTSYELLGFSVMDKKLEQIKSVSNLRDTMWKTWSLNLGFPVQGIYGNCIDLTDINTVERSKNGQILAIGDDNGQIKLFNYPCIDKNSLSDTYYGHSAHVTKLSFTAGDDLLISTGGGDMTVFVWDTDIGSTFANHVEYEPHEDDVENEVKTVDIAKVLKAKMKKKANKEAIAQKQERCRGDETQSNYAEFNEVDVGEGDEFLAVKPWKGQMKPPSNFKRASRDSILPPDLQLQLEWVYGYRGSKSRNNLRQMQDGSLLYYAAGVTVSYNPSTHKQRHFNKHHDDVTAIAFSPDGKYVATGEMGKRPSVFLIDTSTMSTTQFKELKGNGITNSVLAVAYSPSGKVLAIVGGDQDHCIAVYNTENWTCIASGKGDRGAIVDLNFQNDTTFVTSGVKHFKQYTIGAGTGKFVGKLGNFQKLDQRISFCVFNGNDCLTGSINGDLYKWNGTQASMAIQKLHERMIDAITVTPTHIFTGGRDSQVKILSKTYQLQFAIDSTQFKNSINTQIRAIALSQDQDRLWIGTFGHEIIECPVNLQAKSATVQEAKIQIHGHYAPITFLTNEVWGLCTFHNQDLVATVSDDATLRIWDVKNHRQKCMISLEIDINGNQIARVPDTSVLGGVQDNQRLMISLSAQARSIDVNKEETYMALGMRNGTMRVYSAPNWSLTSVTNCAHGINKEEWIEDLKFSPDDKWLVVASHNNKLYLFAVPEFNKPLKAFGVSSSFITHLDWSQDSQSIRTTDGSYELLYYSIPDGSQLKSGASQFRDEPWNTNSCVLGWGVQGIWQAGYDGSDINHADRSHNPLANQSQVIATADDRGLVNVFRYPCPIDSPAKPSQGIGHSSHVTKVRFNASDSHIFSTGGNDCTVMQWKVVVNE